MNDIVLDKSDAKKAQSHDFVFDYDPNYIPPECQSLSWQKMQPFKLWTGDEVSDLRYGLYRALLTLGHYQLTDDDDNNLLRRTHSIFFSCHHCSTFILKSNLIHFKLLKVLDLSPIAKIDVFPLQILRLIWLRYLAVPFLSNFDMPPEICSLWNLQTFIVKGYGRSDIPLHKQIWELMQLRHLELGTFYLPNPPRGSVDKGGHLDFSNIQTISYLSPRCCTKDVISGIQNVKKLGISGNEDDYRSCRNSSLLNNLVHLHQLETLSLKRKYGLRPRILPAAIPSAKVFPATLNKLKLEGTYIKWLYLDIIGELPNLEVLKLKSDACRGEEWYPTVGGFTQLKLLLIEHNDFRHWKATNDNFRVLERLVLIACSELKEIPIKFAEINSLKLIELKDCKSGLAASVARIQQEQQDLGNNPVDVRISNPVEQFYMWLRRAL